MWWAYSIGAPIGAGQISREKHYGSLVVCLDFYGTGVLRTTKMLNFFPIFYIELLASQTVYGIHPRQIPSDLSCWNEISHSTSFLYSLLGPCSGLSDTRSMNFRHQGGVRQVWGRPEQAVMIQCTKIWWLYMLECNISPLGLQKISFLRILTKVKLTIKSFSQRFIYYSEPC